MNNLSVLLVPFMTFWHMPNMEIGIPIPCPKCNGKMYCISYDVTLNILKKRSWQVCKSCNYEISTEKFKQSICCI